jgi:polyribonucleotide nucleotidyltransferase
MNEYKINLLEKELIIKPDNIAEQANGSVFVRYGDTVVLATASMSSEVKEGFDFFPLTVDYEEKFYAAGKIRGSRYVKREGKPSDMAIITSRLIDRTLRPLFPKSLKGIDVQVISTCLSWDSENDPDIIALIASSVALMISDIPFSGPVAAVRIGRKEGEFMLNPTYEERKDSDINIIFSGLKNEEGDVIVNMIEGDIKEVEEDIILDAFVFAKKHIKDICDIQEKIAKEVGKKKKNVEVNDSEIKESMILKMRPAIEDKIISLISKKDKNEKSVIIKDIEKTIKDLIEEESPENESKISDFIEKEIDRKIKENILLNGERPDGRHLDELRPLDSSVSILPRTHGSALFSRGQTKSLSILTLGAPGDHQLLEFMGFTGEKRFLHHYNFPPYSVGETRPRRGPSRRDIGHGMLAEKAIFPIIPEFNEFPYTIRVVSEIMSSNGSTSMASVCSTSLALMDAGVPIKRPVAGISIGIIKDEKNKEYKLLTDIQGLEDHHGGMDLKIAGTSEGLTAIQMDVKIDGIDEKIFSESLDMAKEARNKILQKIEDTIKEPRKELSAYAPRVIKIEINPEKIREVIGPGGKMINEIIGKTGASIDIDDSGIVFVTSEKEESASKAIQWIKDIIKEVEVGEVFNGKVKRILNFGAFVEILPGQEGMIHISKLADHRVDKVEDILKLGDNVSVEVIKIDDQGRIDLSLKSVLEKDDE